MALKLDLAEELKQQVAAIPIPSVSQQTLQALREQAEGITSPPSDSVDRVDELIRKDPPLRVRIHMRRERRGGLFSPCIIGMHGGGYIFGTLAAQDARFEHWCSVFDCVGVSIDYRLAPESPYPAALDDCYAALAWVFDNLERLGIDARRVGVYGPSAGGGLAAALAIRARDLLEYPISFQLLEAAMLDDRQLTASSRAEDLAIWSRESNAFGWASYLEGFSGGVQVPAYAAPSRATDLGGLPAALVIVGGADGFRDENVDYANRLAAAGVPTDLHVLAGAPHGVQMFTESSLMRRWNPILDGWLQAVIEKAVT